jgi:proteasome accessory factor C
VPQGARWIVERHAESAEVLEDEESVKLRANVLPPVQQRVGLAAPSPGPTPSSPSPQTCATPAATSPVNCSRITCRSDRTHFRAVAAG